MSVSSTKPYFLRAIYEWCTDNGFTPYVALKVNAATRVPMEFVRNGEIVLNISFGATSGLKMDNSAITFSARFGGVARELYVPVENVTAIYASENGQGMAFEVTEADLYGEVPEPVETEAVKPSIGLASVNTQIDESDEKPKENTESSKKFGKHSLKIIK